MKKNTQFCQKCRYANTIDEPNCLNCGTRLMIVTFPSSYRHDEPHQPSYYEQFLLEKISVLELQMSKMADSMRKMIGVVETSQDIFKKDHRIVEKLVDMFERLADNSTVVTPKQPENLANNGFINRIITEHDGTKEELFNQLIKDGFKFHSQNEEKQSLGAFERAVAVSPKNVALLTFIGKILFEQENNESAVKYLEKARIISPNNEKVLLLSATIYTQLARFDDAKFCLDAVVSNTESTFCVNFIKGFVLYAKEDLEESMSAFQECMSVLPAAETAYLFGCILYQVKQDEPAKNVLEIAVKLDENFADAWFMLSQISLNSGNKLDSGNYLKKASEAKDSRSQCFEFLNGKKEFPIAALPFIESKFFLKGSKRLSELFKRELEKVLNR